MADAAETGRTDPSGDIRFASTPDLPGVTLIQVHKSTHLWRVFHETYSCCVIPEEGNVRHAASFWRYRGKSHVSYAGRIMLMEPGEVHDAWKATAPGTYFVLQFAPEVVAPLARDLGLASLPHLRVAETEDRRLAAAMDALRRSCSGDTTALGRQTLLARAVRTLIARHAERPGQTRLADVAPGRLRLARDFIVEHHAERITLDDLVALTGVSRFHLLRSFTKAFGVPPHRLQLLVRISEAQKQLLAGYPPAAVAVGFADQSHFTRHFRRALGVTPAGFQRQRLASPRDDRAISF